MSRTTIQLDDAVYEYLLSSSVRETDLMADLRRRTARMDQAGMQTSPEQGQLMGLLVKLIGARRALEVGTFTGYSALWVAAALPDDGRLVACDIADTWVDIGRTYWQRAGVADLIDTRIGPAAETLDELVAADNQEPFDFAYIDADKPRYVDYYERCLQLVGPGGLVAVDNTLWSGKVADEANQEDDTVAIRQFNAHLADDQRVDLSMIPIGDGLTLARKR